MSSTFKGFDNEDSNWDIPNPVKWERVSGSGASFSTISSRAPPVHAPQSSQDAGLIRQQAVGTAKSYDERETATHADSSVASILEEERDLFEKARKYLIPSFFFRFVISMYAQRKMNVFFLVHFASTTIIWMHFALIKFEEQAGKVPEGAHRYWLKRLVSDSLSNSSPTKHVNSQQYSYLFIFVIVS
jgi:hypothetical protein